MKIDRHNLIRHQGNVKLGFTRRRLLAICTGLLLGYLGKTPSTLAQDMPATAAIGELAPQPAASTPPTKNSADQQPPTADIANEVLEQVIERLALGDSFDCKVRQGVRTDSREVPGVGTYVQVGQGTGRFAFQVQILDGDGKHSLQQISDGRLAWTRTDIAGDVFLSRVDVGWLDEGARTLHRKDSIKPSHRVGGPSEMLDTIRRDFDLKLGTSDLNGRPLLVIIGDLKQARREALLQSEERSSLPDLFPTRVNIAVAKEDNPETGFGKGLPLRIEHLSDPIASDGDVSSEKQSSQTKSIRQTHRQMISLLEFYSIRPISSPPIQRFRFENQDVTVDFVNETWRYEKRFNIQVSAKERARFR